MEHGPHHLPNSFLRLVRHPLKFRVFLFRSLPAALFAGLRLVSIDENACAVAVRYRWATRNPFRSVYFAVLSMAAELPTGLLAAGWTWKAPVSLLLTGVEGEFIRKAKGRILFTCTDGGRLREAAAAARRGGDWVKVQVVSEGRNGEGEVVARFRFTWAMKARQAASFL